MFNDKKKIAFIHQYSDRESVRNKAFALFSAATPYEESFQKDLAEFTDDEMSVFFSNKTGLRSSSRMPNATIINAYLKWCVASGVNVVCSGIKQDDNTLVAAFRNKMVFNPEHLNRYMDAVFGRVEDGTSGLICRCYLWLAFCGLTLDEAERVDDSDVNLKSMTVSVHDREISLYAESKPAFVALRNLTEFRVFNPVAPDKIIMMQREGGSRFLRGTKRSGVSKERLDPGDRGNTSGEIKRRTGKAVKNGAVTTRLNFRNVGLSGLFFRMYERESRGIKADFYIIAAEEIENREFANKKSYNASVCRIKNNYIRDYNIWKSAYELYKKDSHL